MPVNASVERSTVGCVRWARTLLGDGADGEDGGGAGECWRRLGEEVSSERGERGHGIVCQCSEIDWRARRKLNLAWAATGHMRWQKGIYIHTKDCVDNGKMRSLVSRAAQGDWVPRQHGCLMDP